MQFKFYNQLRDQNISLIIKEKELILKENRKSKINSKIQEERDTSSEFMTKNCRKIDASDAQTILTLKKAKLSELNIVKSIPKN